MSRLYGRKKVFVIGAVCALIAAGGAYAYWTAGGSGTGTGQAGTTTALVANQTTVLNDMYPGDSAQTIAGNFDNDNAGPIEVTSVTAAIASVTQAGGAAGACDATDFTLATPTMNVGVPIAHGHGVGAWTGATIKFNNKAGVNQDGCKGATVHLSYTIA